jgi:hypothetical protein
MTLHSIDGRTIVISRGTKSVSIGFSGTGIVFARLLDSQGSMALKEIVVEQ